MIPDAWEGSITIHGKLAFFLLEMLQGNGNVLNGTKAPTKGVSLDENRNAMLTKTYREYEFLPFVFNGT